MLAQNLAEIVRFIFVASAALVGLTGCGVVQQLSVQDTGSPAVAVRAAIRPTAWARGDLPGPGIEIGYERFRAKDSRLLGAGESISLGGQVINGPDTVSEQVTVQIAHLAYTHRHRYGANFELEPFAGVANFNLRFATQAATSPLRPGVNDSRTIAIGGVTPRWRFNEWLAMEARVTGLLGSSVSGSSLDAALLLSPVPNLSLRLGYSKRQHAVDFDVNTSWTKIEVRSRGPSASLALDF